MVSPADIDAAAELIRAHVRRTPVMNLEPGYAELSAELFLKLELFQHTGSFKPRGAFHRILRSEVPEAGVITASGGNHGQAVAYVCRTLGLRAEIFVPAGSPPLKAERIRRFGAQVTVTGEFYDDAMEACLKRAEETGALLVHPYDHPQVVAGQGTVGRELEEQLPQLDTVLVAAGGGGLAAGVAAWYAGRRRVIAVEPEGCPALARALEAGEPVEVPVGGVAADSLGARRIGAVPFAVARELIDAAVLVSDEAILEAQWRLWDSLRILAEPGGVAALAALLSGAYVPQAGERVGAIVCGGNTASLPQQRA
ncbi:MAG: threonine/serine dehydratase [Acidobacteriota bacterium]|jgi:threonine dehydratase